MTSSPKTIAQIPTISELRHALDYAEGDKPHYDCHDFIDDLRSFRRVFRTAAGTEGRDLHQWKSRDHHLGLREMVDAYLDRDGKGVEFWPDDPSKRYYSSSLQYTRDKSIIQRNLKLLLFRLNLQQHRNAKYKHAKHPKSGAQATSPSEPGNIDETIRIRAIWPAEEDVKPTNLASQPFTTIRFNTSGVTTDKPPTDPFAVAISRESSQPLQAQHRFRVVGTDKSQTSSKATPDAHRAKRAKTHHDGPDGLTRSTPIVIPEDLPEDHEEDETPAEEARRTPRKTARQKRRDPIYASPEEYDAATRDPPQTPAATSEVIERTKKKASAKAPKNSSSKPSQVVKLKLPQALSAQPSAGQHRQPSARLSTSPTIPRALKQTSTRDSPEYVAPMAPMAQMTEVSTEQSPDVPSAGLRPEPSEQTDQPSGPEPPPGTSTRSAAAPSPSEKAAENAVPVNPPTENTITPSRTTPKEAPAVHFTYRLVISREHPEKNKEWTPQGGFRDITLVRLMREMPLDFDTDFSGFQFALWGPAIRVSHRVLNGQNAEFDAMKQKFEASIVSCMMEAQSGKTIEFELEVQPITSEVQATPASPIHGLAAPQW